MEIGFILANHDKADDLLAHADILRFFPVPKALIVVHSGDGDPPAPEGARVKIPSCGFRKGPLMALLAGLKEAAAMGVKRVCYRNGDDWLFNHPFAVRNFEAMRAGPWLAAGYNWLSCGTHHDFAFNELYLDVAACMANIADAELAFSRPSFRICCERKLGRWLRDTIDLGKQFLRLSGRECWPCIGLEPKDATAFASTNPVPPGFWEKQRVNNRFFCEAWQMIGSHDNLERYGYWIRIRDRVPYAKPLQSCEHFHRWMDSARGHCQWNSREPNLSRLQSLGQIPGSPPRRRPGIPRCYVPVPRRPKAARLDSDE